MKHTELNATQSSIPWSGVEVAGTELIGGTDLDSGFG
jgi:hypothetical protein